MDGIEVASYAQRLSIAMLARGVSAILTCSKIMHRHDLMTDTPKTTIDPNTLALHETAQVATHYGHTLWTTKVNNGNLY